MSGRNSSNRRAIFCKKGEIAIGGRSAELTQRDVEDSDGSEKKRRRTANITEVEPVFPSPAGTLPAPNSCTGTDAGTCWICMQVLMSGCTSCGLVLTAKHAELLTARLKLTILRLMMDPECKHHCSPKICALVKKCDRPLSIGKGAANADDDDDDDDT